MELRGCLAKSQGLGGLFNHCQQFHSQSARKATETTVSGWHLANGSLLAAVITQWLALPTSNFHTSPCVPIVCGEQVWEQLCRPGRARLVQNGTFTLWILRVEIYLVSANPMLPVRQGAGRPHKHISGQWNLHFCNLEIIEVQTMWKVSMLLWNEHYFSICLLEWYWGLLSYTQILGGTQYF